MHDGCRQGFIGEATALNGSGIILCTDSVNGRRHYNVTSSLIGCVHKQNDPRGCVARHRESSWCCNLALHMDPTGHLNFQWVPYQGVVLIYRCVTSLGIPMLSYVHTCAERLRSGGGRILIFPLRYRGYDLPFLEDNDGLERAVSKRTR